MSESKIPDFKWGADGYPYVNDQRIPGCASTADLGIITQKAVRRDVETAFHAGIKFARFGKVG